MSFPGGLGTTLARGPGVGPIWMLSTPRGPAALALDHDGLLDRDDVHLEDRFFSDAPAHVERVVNFLRTHRHEALPRYVDHWIARDRTIHQYSATSGWDAPIHHLLSERSPGTSAHRYLQAHRSPGAGLPPALALRIVERLADLCRLAHAAGVVHGGILLDAVRVQAKGRPVLERWTCGRRAVGNVGCDFEDLWSGVRDVLGGDVPSPLPAGDVFALGSLLAALVTGEPAYQRGPRRHAYRPPSARGPGFAWLDELVGLACDPAQGFGLDAATLRERLAALLAARRPSVECVHTDLTRGEFRSLAEYIASSPDADLGPLTPAVCGAVERDLLGALTAGRAWPLFSELLLATCPAALPIVRTYARARETPAWGRHGAVALLALADDPDALTTALAADLDAWPVTLGWSVRPALVDATGTPCPHPWTSLVGDPIVDERGELRRECPHCGGPVQSASAWFHARPRGAPPPLDLADLPRLVVLTATGSHEREVWPGGLTSLGSDPSATLTIAGLDPADHARLSALDAFRVAFIHGVFGLPFLDGSELRASVLDTRSVGTSLVLGPLRFEASAPGRITIHAAPGVPLELAPSSS